MDSFLKFLATGLAGKGLEVVANPEGALGVNKVNVLFMTSTPIILTNPGFRAMEVSVDVIGAEEDFQRSRRKAMEMARSVDEVLSTFSVPKEDFTDPTAPVSLGTNIYPEFWGSWRRVPDPESRFEHLNRPVLVRYFEEPR